MPMHADYPDDLRRQVERGFSGLGVAAEIRYAKALRLGIADPGDPRVVSEVIGLFVGNTAAAMLLGATRIRLRLARDGRYPRCFWEEA